ncbi:PRC and DUF2382 domain-containing protein [Streptomyces venetus]|uniref:PRC and DUF2382 domain-containing protein n=1 Tax=Streptomyces venetus TaxID=1701086 RepID=A0ABP8H7L8_9ACTN
MKTGLFGTSESFVPIHDASIVEDHLEVPYAKDTVKDAPNVDVDAGGHLSEDEEHLLYEHYHIDWDAAWQQANRAGEGGWARAGTGTSVPSGDETDALATAVSGTARPDDAMTRSEERMRVGVERREAGRARLRKYVVTEEVQLTVPVRHEGVRVEREPITDENRDAALSGPEISDAEHEVILHEERPVTQTETVPVERVRMSTEEHTEEETVRGQVRKERIDTEGVDDEGGRDT